MALLLGADVGTSSLKVALFDETLRVRAQSRQEYATLYPGPGAAEQDPDEWVRAFCRGTRAVLEAAGARKTDVAAVGIDGMSSTVLPVDAAGSPLRPAMIWLDRRAQAEAERGRTHHGAALLAIGGNRSDASSFAPKVAWIRDHEPSVYERAACFLHCNAYLVQQLTGAFTMDVSEAGLSLLCDIRTGAYSIELLDAWGLDSRKLPDVLRCTDVAGTITGAAALESGLAEGTPVIAGAMDNVAATVGLGLRHDGDAYIAAGTVTNVGILRDRPVLDGKGLVYQAGLDGRWLVNGGADYGGAGLLWFRNLLQDADLTALGELGAATSCGEHPMVFLPYMAGQRAPLWNESTSGVVLGITPGTERRHLARMFMESVALGARHVFEELCAVRPERAALTGGITNSPAWSQMVADATGIRLSLCAQPEVSPMGAVILAGLGVGLFRDVEDAFARLPPGPECVPSQLHRGYYEALYRVFSAFYCNVLESWRSLDRLRRAPGPDASPGQAASTSASLEGEAAVRQSGSSPTTLQAAGTGRLRGSRMRAAVLHAPGILRVEEVPTPAPAAGEVLVRVASCGVCGSDVPRLVGQAAHGFPIILGHEFSGTVVAVGEGGPGELLGRSVACAPLLPDFSDPQCARGHFALGKGYGFIGSRQPGGFAEYVAMPHRNAVALPDGVELAAAAFLEPLTVGLHAVQVMGFLPGRSVAITGVGGIGLLLLQSLRALGAGSITVFDVDGSRLEVALSLGADRAHDSRGERVAEVATAETGAGGFEFVFETAGAPAAEILALRLAAPRGQVMLVGTPHVALTLQPHEFELVNRKELTVRGSWMNYSAPFPGWEWEFGARLLAAGRIRTDPLVDRVLPLARAGEIPGLLGRRGELKGKLLLDCTWQAA